MNISQRFDRQPWSNRLGRRGSNFKMMCEHAASKPGSYIVETGTAWDPNNFEYQGQSSLIWDWLLHDEAGATLKTISIDIRPEASDYAKKHCSKVDFKIGDSPRVLNSLPKSIVENISVLYLDSFDWSDELNLLSAMHHLVELTSVWAALPGGCLIAVDDRHGDERGKHWLVEKYMTLLGYETCFKNHQIGWIK